MHVLLSGKWGYRLCDPHKKENEPIKTNNIHEKINAGTGSNNVISWRM